MKYLLIWSICILCTGLKAQQVDSLLAQNYYDLGFDFFRKEQGDSAIFYLEKASGLFKELNLTDSYVKSLITTNEILMRSQRLGEAIIVGKQMEQEAIRLLQADRHYFLQIYNNMAVTYAYLGEAAQRDAYVEKGEKWAELYVDTPDETAGYLSLLSNIGSFLIDEREYHRGIAYQLRGLNEIEGQEGEHPIFLQFAVVAHTRIGQANMGLGEYEKSVIAFEKAKQLMQTFRLEDRVRTDEINRFLAKSLYLNHKYDEALRLCKELLTNLNAYQSKYQRNLLEAEVRLVMAHCYTNMEDFFQAKQAFDRAIELREGYYLAYQGLQRHENVGIIYSNLGKMRLMQGRKVDALQLFQEALIHSCLSFEDTSVLSNPELDDTKSASNYLTRILKAKADTQYELAKESNDIAGLDLAFATYQLLIAVMDRERKILKADETKLYMLNQAAPTFEAAINILWDLYELTQSSKYISLAFKLAEKNKSVLLYAALKDGDAKYAAAVPDSILEQEQTLRDQKHHFQEKILRLSDSDPNKDSLLKQYDTDFFELEIKLDRLLTSLKINYPVYYDISYQQEVIPMQEVQQKLISTKSGMIEYFWGEESIFAISLNGTEASFLKLDSDSTSLESISSILTALHQNGSEFEEKDFRARLFDLDQWLLTPALSELGTVEHLIIIPDGPLGYLPFEILQREADQNQPVYLLEQYPISYANSATLLFLEHARPKASIPFMGYGPSYEGQLQLPYTEQEVQTLQALMGGQAYTGRQATEKWFRETGLSAQILHFAMHGFPNTEQPSQSSLLFQADPDIEDDGHLYAYELYNLDLSAELAVLSACRTGYGPIAKGEGIRSLARAFQYAGCPSIVMSLWEANGVVAKDLMPLFYQHLKDGLPKDVALQRAKLEYLADAPAHLRDPRLWANFVLVGDPEKLATTGSHWEWWILLSVLFIVGIGVWVMRSNKS